MDEKSALVAPSRLKSILRLVASRQSEDLDCFEYNSDVLSASHSTLMKRRRRKHHDLPVPNHSASFEHLATRHQYVCFFVVQGNASNFYSNHCLLLRRRLSQDYHDVMTTFLLSMGDDTSVGIFCEGTGFSHLPSTPTVRSLLNISQVPCVIVVDVKTGQKMPQDAMLAMEWNDAHTVINSWQRGRSGLSCTQKMLAVAALQSNCIIQ